MTVEATCGDCGDVHPVADRRLDGTATACPACGSTSYASSSTDEPIMKPERERIADAVRDADGVGPKTLETIQGTFPTLAELEAADREQLLEIEHVGPKAADAILKQV